MLVRGTGDVGKPRELYEATVGSLADQEREAALEALRRRRANPPEKIDNAALPAGAPMYFYCRSCGHIADVKPETYQPPRARLCKECQEMKDHGWME